MMEVLELPDADDAVAELFRRRLDLIQAPMQEQETIPSEVVLVPTPASASLVPTAVSSLSPSPAPAPALASTPSLGASTTEPSLPLISSTAESSQTTSTVAVQHVPETSSSSSHAIECFNTFSEKDDHTSSATSHRVPLTPHTISSTKHHIHQASLGAI
jgi:hypothetical protein